MGQEDQYHRHVSAGAFHYAVNGTRGETHQIGSCKSVF